MHVPWCMSGSLNLGGGGKRSRDSRRMRNSQIYVSGKRPMLTWPNSGVNHLRRHISSERWKCHNFFYRSVGLLKYFALFIFKMLGNILEFCAVKLPTHMADVTSSPVMQTTQTGVVLQGYEAQVFIERQVCIVLMMCNPGLTSPDDARYLIPWLKTALVSKPGHSLGIETGADGECVKTAEKS